VHTGEVFGVVTNHQVADDRWQRLPVAGTVDKLVAVLRADYSSLLAAV
jgi:hypothetical protein